MISISLLDSAESYLMIGNTRWHWASKIEEQWKYFHTSPNPIEFKGKDYAQLSWASVGPIPDEINLSPSKKINLTDIPLINFPKHLGIDRGLASWSAFNKQLNLKNKKQGLIVIDAGTILSITKITENGKFDGGQLIPGLKLQLSSMAKGALNLKNPTLKIIPKDTFQFETKNSMIKGVINCLLGSILQVYEETKLPIWLCGGDGPMILNELKSKNIDINYHPNLVLEGMIDIHKKLIQFKID